MQQHPQEHDSFSSENMTRRTSCHAYVPHFWSDCYIRQIKHTFCAVFVDFISCDVTVVLPLKMFRSRFLLPYVYFKKFKNAKIIWSLAKI